MFYELESGNIINLSYVSIIHPLYGGGECQIEINGTYTDMLTVTKKDYDGIKQIIKKMQI